jgi:hypothetical protein
MSDAILRVGGSTAGIHAFLKRTALKPHRVYLRGEPMSPGSVIVSRRSYFLIAVSRASDGDFAKQTRAATRFVRQHMRDLKALPRHKLHAVIDFGVYDTRTKQSPLLSWRFPVSLLKLFAAAAIESEISVL